MEEIRKKGATILFVSHSMEAMTRLCRRAILFSDGAIADDGSAEELAKSYLGSFLQLESERVWADLNNAPGNEIVRLRAVRVRAMQGAVSETIDIREPVGVEMEYDVLIPGYALTPNFHFFNEQRTYLFVSVDNGMERSLPKTAGRYTSTVWVPGNFFAEGIVLVNAAISTFDPEMVHVNESDVVTFKVIDTLDVGTARGGLNRRSRAH